MSSLTGLSPNNPTKYLGPNVALPIIVTVPREPTDADIKQPTTGRYYSFGTFWLVGKNPTTGLKGDLWYLAYIANNASNWVKISSGLGDKLPFTPTFSLATPGTSSFTYSFQFGEYTVVSNLVFFNMRIALSNFTIGTGSGNVQMGPLPFASGASANTVFACTLQSVTFDVGVLWYSGLLTSGSSNVIFPGLVTATTQSVLQAASLTNTTIVNVSGTYFLP